MKYVKILRGIPGSGKSTFAQSLVGNNLARSCGLAGGTVVVSADDFFMVNGKYQFDATKLGAAHATCFNKFQDALEDPNVTTVIVDNTNTTVKEMAKYVEAAHGSDNENIEITIVKVVCDPEIAAKRNSHGVPVDKVLSMWQRMESNPVPNDWAVVNVEVTSG
jgi:tRNA uridine 5-carbamoylmethylation protein Kti12